MDLGVGEMEKRMARLCEWEMVKGGVCTMPCELGGDRAPQSASPLGKRGVNMRGDRCMAARGMLEGVRGANLEDEWFGVKRTAMW